MEIKIENKQVDIVEIVEEYLPRNNINKNKWTEMLDRMMLKTSMIIAMMTENTMVDLRRKK